MHPVIKSHPITALDWEHDHTDTHEPGQPKEKPLRMKRGHRKPSALPDLDKHDQPPSPSSETSRANGATSRAAIAVDDVDSPFMLYVVETGDGPGDADALRESWEEMEAEERDAWFERFEDRVARKEEREGEGEDTEAEIEAEPEIEVEGDGEGGGKEGDETEMDREEAEREGSEKEKGEGDDEDVEMGDADEKK